MPPRLERRRRTTATPFFYLSLSVTPRGPAVEARVPLWLAGLVDSLAKTR